MGLSESSTVANTDFLPVGGGEGGAVSMVARPFFLVDYLQFYVWVVGLHVAQAYCLRVSARKELPEMPHAAA